MSSSVPKKQAADEYYIRTQKFTNNDLNIQNQQGDEIEENIEIADYNPTLPEPHELES